MFINFIFDADRCKCKSFIDSNDFGNCQGTKMTNQLYGYSVGCYVEQPSGCPDLTESTNIPEEQVSFEACAINEGESIIYHEN